jgi:hypothetical protein
LIYEDAPKPVLRRDRIVVAVASQERCPPFWLGSTLQKTPDRRSPGQPSYGRGFSMTGVHSCVGDFKSLLTCWLLALSAVVVASLAYSDSPSLQHRYFLVVWGYQGAGNLPRNSHTFLTVYRGDDLAEGRVIPATISWFPADRGVHLVGVERGHNFSLPQTLAIACRGRKRVTTGDLMNRGAHGALGWMLEKGAR